MSYRFHFNFAEYDSNNFLPLSKISVMYDKVNPSKHSWKYSPDLVAEISFESDNVFLRVLEDGNCVFEHKLIDGLAVKDGKLFIAKDTLEKINFKAAKPTERTRLAVSFTENNTVWLAWYPLKNSQIRFDKSGFELSPWA